MGIIRYTLRLIVSRLIGQKRIKKLLPVAAGLAGLDLLTIAYNSIGILNCGDAAVSGERFLISTVLKDKLAGVPRPVLFDVGANIGKYSKMLFKEFPCSDIYAFEPNSNTFALLSQDLKGSVELVNAGLGSEEKVKQIYTYSDSTTSSHASVYKEVFEVFHRAEGIISMDFTMTTLDKFCADREIKRIDFIKIDTEGNELDVLRGAARMLSEKRIGMIQFEFGECDVFSRVFLRDFYDILHDFDIYRLNSNSLIPMTKYVSTNEIFRFQNLIAIHKGI